MLVAKLIIIRVVSPIYVLIRVDNRNMGCVVAMVGDSSNEDFTWSTTKTISIPTGLICPKFVEKSVWLGGGDFSDTFSVEQNGTQLTISRLDSNSVWGLNLMFLCCPPGICFY